MRTANKAHDSVRAFRIEGLSDSTVIRAAYRNQRFAAHSHPTFVAGVVTDGALRFRCRGRVWTASAGAVFLTNPDEVQTGEPADTSGWSYWSAYLPPAVFEGIAPDGAPSRLPYFPTHVLEDRDAQRVLIRFFNEVTSLKLPLAQATISLDCLAYLMRRFAGTPEPKWPKREPRLIGTAKEYMAANFGEQLSLEDVASVTNVTGFHVTRVFKANTGLSLHAWLVQFRVERARELLMRGTAAADVASACGFSDQPHMTRWFKRIVGLTPRQVQSMSRTFNI
jgi:AraC-like DNA-binding protein